MPLRQSRLRGDADYFGGQQYNAFAGGCTLELLSDGLSSNWHVMESWSDVFRIFVPRWTY